MTEERAREILRMELAGGKKLFNGWSALAFRERVNGDPSTGSVIRYKPSTEEEQGWVRVEWQLTDIVKDGHAEWLEQLAWEARAKKEAYETLMALGYKLDR